MTLRRQGATGGRGAYRPWWVVCGCALCLFVPGALIFGFPGVLAAHWQESFGVGRAAVGGVLFFSLGGLGVLNLASVWFPPGFTHRQRMYVGTAACALGLLILVASDGLWGVYLWGFVSGAGAVLVYVSALTLSQGAAPRRRGLVSGLVSMVFGVSAAMLAPVFSWMLRSLGYERMLVVLVAVTFGAGLAAMQLVRYPPPRSIPTPQERPSAAPAARTTPPIGLGIIVRQPSTWALWAVLALFGGASIAMVTLAVGLGVSKGYSAAASLVILTAFNLTNGVSRLATGMLSDHLGRRLTMALAFAPAGLAYLVLPHVGSLSLTALLAAVVGFGFGTMFAVSAPLVVEIFGLEGFALAFSLVMTGYGFLSGLLGPLAAGYLLDLTDGDYVVALGYLGGLCLVSALLVLVARPRRIRAAAGLPRPFPS